MLFKIQLHSIGKKLSDILKAAMEPNKNQNISLLVLADFTSELLCSM